MTLDWSIVGVVLPIVLAVGGFGKWALDRLECTVEKTVSASVTGEKSAREAATSAILAGQSEVREDLHEIKESFERRVDRLEQNAKDFRSGTSIDTSIDHAKRNILQVVGGIKENVSGHTVVIELFRERITRLETQSESHGRAVSEVRDDLKEVRREINGRLDKMTEMQKDQFDQLCTSIREISKREPKG